MFVASVVGGLVWVASFFGVERIDITGASLVPVEQIVAESGLVVGRPLITIRPPAIEEKLTGHPRIAAASVKLVFPDRVKVTVRERVDAAVIELADNWAVVAYDAVVVDYAAAPDDSLPLMRIPLVDPGLGQAIGQPAVLGALEFLAALPEEFTLDVVISERDHQLWAWVGNRAAKLGPPTDLERKALSLVALLSSNTEDGLIDVTAPNRPAIRPWVTTDPDVEDLKL